ncbi:hypothetical protein TRIP_B200777 [uncultured Desulfatiglans sp.]|nr:hypothetical protein TRIP_B200777 [uncultured Desulfatiglans sp.]
MNAREKEALAVLGYFFLSHRKAEKARILFQALVGLFPEEARFVESLSYAYLMTGEYERSLAAAEAFLLLEKERNRQALGYLLKTLAYRSLGEEENACECLNAYLVHLRK